MRELKLDTSGNMLALGALGLLVTMSLVGGGVDMSRAYKAQSRLQAACDAGVLAGRKAVRTNGFDDNAEDEAEDYFNNNFDEDEQGATDTSFIASSPDNGNTVNGTATSDVQSTVMR
ncbi:MAG: Tad domain-containing protein, partial [Sphingomonadaceae bacterium]|nr:Tad domain-containing protein [Sphingomonadaceae bacterium]